MIPSGLKLKDVLRIAPSFVARIIQLLFGFVIVLLLAHALEPEQLGYFYVLTTVGIALQLVVFKFLHFPIQRTMPSDGGVDRFCSTFVLATIIPLSLLAAASMLLPYLPTPADAAIVTMIFVLSEVMQSQATNFSSAFRRPLIYLMLVATRSVVVVSTILLAGEEVDSTYAMLAFALGNTLASLIAIYSVVPRISLRAFDGRLLLSAITYTWPYTLSETLRQTMTRSDRIIVALMLGPTAAGQYSVITDLARRVLQGVCINARLAFIRDAVDAIDGPSPERLRSVLRTIASSVLMLGTPAALVIACLSPWTVGYLLPSGFDGTAPILTVMAIAFLWESVRLYAVDVVFELSYASWLDLAVSSLGSVTFLCLFPLGLAYGGLTAGAVAVLATQITATLFSIWAGRARTKIEVPVKQIIASLVVVTAFASLFSFVPLLDKGTDLMIVGASAIAAGVLAMLGQALLLSITRRKA